MLNFFPELYLNSLNEHYGPDYQSGQIRIAFVPGNKNLGRTLSGGVILGDSKAARSYGIRKSDQKLDWSRQFNRFGVIWREGKLFYQEFKIFQLKLLK